MLWIVTNVNEAQTTHDMLFGPRYVTNQFFIWFRYNAMTMDWHNKWRTEIGKTNDEGLDPNGMWCVVWAMGMFVFPIFTYLTNFLFSLATTTTNMHNEQYAEMGDNGQWGTGPKQCVACCLGPGYVCLCFLFLDYFNLLVLLWLTTLLNLLEWNYVLLFWAWDGIKLLAIALNIITWVFLVA